jgi:hypothetical protein
LKPEWWGSSLVQEEKYQEKPVKREEIIIIIIMYNMFIFASNEYFWLDYDSDMLAASVMRAMSHRPDDGGSNHL